MFGLSKGGWLSRLFGRGATATPAPAAPTPAAATAPGTLLHYDPGLLGRLTADHQALLALFQDLVAANRAGEQRRVRSLLDAFEARLDAHLLAENTRLYVYLQRRLPRDSAEWRTMHDFQHEMKGVGHALVAFMGRYRGEQWDAARHGALGTELEAIGAVLVRRIQAEEKVLYPQYAAPPGAA